MYINKFVSNLLEIVSSLPEFASPSKAKIWVFKDMATIDLKSENQKQRSVMVMFTLFKFIILFLLLLFLLIICIILKTVGKKLIKQ